MHGSSNSIGESLTNAEDLIKRPFIRKRLIGDIKPTRSNLSRLTLQLAERARKIWILERLGFGHYAAENIYPQRKKDDDGNFQDDIR